MITRLLLAIVLVIAGFAAGLAVTGGIRAATNVPGAPGIAAPAVEPPPSETTGAASAPVQPTPAAPAAQAVAAGPDFTRVAAEAVKSVVNISSEQVIPRRNSPFLDDPFFQYFFGEQGSRSRRSLSLGSGVVVSGDGYVVTNSHVVGEDVRRIRQVTVTLGDKREVPGAVVGTDPATDIALVKLDVKGIPAMRWGDSAALKVGEWVLAIGSPFQLSQTVTAGIVSATGRSNVGFTAYEDFIQTDAAINPGNSGGALVNARGELVGINTGIFSQSGGYQGIGFAVPSVLARRIVDDLVKYGEVRRGAIDGIQLETMTPDIARQLGSTTDRGALVVALYRGTDAVAAGFRRWDIVVRYNGAEVTDTSQLFRLVADSRIGSTATITVEREGRTVDLKVPIVAAGRPR